MAVFRKVAVLVGRVDEGVRVFCICGAEIIEGDVREKCVSARLASWTPASAVGWLTVPACCRCVVVGVGVCGKLGTCGV